MIYVPLVQHLLGLRKCDGFNRTFVNVGVDEADPRPTVELLLLLRCRRISDHLISGCDNPETSG